MWYDVPGRGEAWKEEQLQALNWDYEAFAQENECEFLGSSGTLISGAKLKQLVAQKPIYEQNQIKIFFNDRTNAYSYITKQLRA